MKNQAKKVRVRVRQVGQSFGCCGQVVSRNGLLCGEGPVRPMGFDAVAERDALEIAARMGWEVIS